MTTTTEPTIEEAEWCVSLLRSQLDIFKKLSEPIDSVKISIFKRVLVNSGLFTDQQLYHVNSKDEIIQLHQEMIDELERKFLGFDPEDDVAIKYLRSIGAREDLIEHAKSRVTPENIKRA
jgi:hypothetical protein